MRVGENRLQTEKTRPCTCTHTLTHTQNVSSKLLQHAKTEREMEGRREVKGRNAEEDAGIRLKLPFLKIKALY